MNDIEEDITRADTVHPNVERAVDEQQPKANARTRAAGANKLIESPGTATASANPAKPAGSVQEEDPRGKAESKEKSSSPVGDETREIYELKNYAYLRPERMKNIRLNLRASPRVKDQQTPPQ